MNFLRGEHKFCSFELWTDLPLGYITQREERLREKRKMFQIKHYITGPPQREEIIREIKNKIFKYY